MNSKELIDEYVQILKTNGNSDEMILDYLRQIDQFISFYADKIDSLNHNYKNTIKDNIQTIKNSPSTILSRAELWAVACGADNAFANGQYCNDLMTGISQQDCRSMLSDYWDIDSTEEAIETIEWLFKEGHRFEFDLIWQAINMVSIKESKEFLREQIATDEYEEVVVLNRLRNLRDALEVFKQRNLFDNDTLPDMLIWDYARIINLSRGCFDAGYLTREVAMDNIMKAAGVIRKTYQSWKQLSISYQFADYFWRGIDMDVFNRHLAGMEVLLTNPNSPWVLLNWDDGVSV